MPDRAKTQTILITVVASAISSVAFGVSIFAMGLLWLIPSVRPVVPNIPNKVKDKSRRRSAPPILQHHLPQPKPVVVETQPSTSVTHNSPRRVYFLDSQLRPSSQRRYSDLSQLSSTSTTQSDEVSLSSSMPSVQNDPESSPRSSSSTLVFSQADASQESIESKSSSQSHPGSASSSRPSLSLATHFPGNMKKFKEKKRPSSSQSAADSGAESTQSEDVTPSSSKSARRSSLGFTAPWLNKNRRPTVDLTSPVESPTTPKVTLPSESTPINSPSSPSGTILYYFGRSASLNNDRRRRTSAPSARVPPARTQPYAYPYFAAPPTAGGPDQPLPQQAPGRSSTSSYSSEESVVVVDDSKPQSLEDKRTSEERQSANERRQQNAKAQSSLGHGRKPTQQRRAVTEIITAS
ncbi:hypothetical protein K435DRAFT_853829 [Dendrothele bispora CBS 962.96]|uniref:Uncharacterized protein n=1 Tax=Dendrothele bispora (strain CBS 962.96) TaxID=1314807 RepID=A0A4S8MFL8_DENBC|nr:hypothetical protein K435DRAFT_853829 [Dendrothele bispora CBS 962.96]